MADDKEVQELTIADEAVLKKYKEAGEITNSWVEKRKSLAKKFHASTQQFNRVFYQSLDSDFAMKVVSVE